MPEFGNTDDISSGSANIINSAYGNVFSCPGEGTATSITAKILIYGGPHDVCMLLYDSAGNLVDKTEQKTLQSGSSHYEQFNFLDPKPSLFAQDYLLVAWAGGPGIVELRVNSSEDPLYVDGHAYNYDNPPDPHAMETYINCTSLIFCTYTSICGEMLNQTDCEDAGCYWYNGFCHDAQPTSCEILDNEPDCAFYNCYWYNGSCHADLPTCGVLNNEPDCSFYNCYWYNGACHDAQPACEILNNEPDCSFYNCYWYNGACHTNIPACEDYDNQTECEDAGCYWYATSQYPGGHCWDSPLTDCGYIRQEDCENLNNGTCYWYNGSCHDTAPSCDALNNQSDCLAYNCYWYNDLCHATAPACEDYGNPTECEDAGCYWWNDFCHDAQPASCEILDNEPDCAFYNCYWCNGICQSTSCDEIPWTMIAATVASAIIIGIAILKRKRK